MNFVQCCVIILSIPLSHGYVVLTRQSNSSTTTTTTTSNNGKIFKADLDFNQLRGYLLNEKFLGILKICLFQNGPCDVIGRWVKPRLASALFNTPCESCTANQVALLHEFLRMLHSKYPNILDFARPTLEKLVLANLPNTMGGIEPNRNSTGSEATSQKSVNGTQDSFVKTYDERVKKALSEFNFADSDASHRPFSISVPILS